MDRFAGSGRYGVGLLTSMDKAYRARGRVDGKNPFETEGEEIAEVKLSAAGNEYVSFQLVIEAYTDPVERIRLEASDLIGPVRIDAANVEVRKILYSKTDGSASKTPYTGWWPDPLYDYDPIDVEPTYRKINKRSNVGKNHEAIWLTVYVPEGTPQGIYRGKITLIPANLPSVGIPVKLRVRDFAIPRESSLPTSFWLHPEWMQQFYLMDSVPAEFYKRFADFTGKYRLGPDDPGYVDKIWIEKDGRITFDLGPAIPFLEALAPHTKALNVGLSPNFGTRFTNFTAVERKTGNEVKIRHDFLSPTHKKLTAAYLKEACALFKKRGWWEKAYVEAWDEPGQNDRERFNELHALIHKAVPGLRTLCPIGHMKPEFSNAIDIWVPLSSKWEKNQKFIASERRKGKAVWWYVCCGPGYPYCNFFTDRPGIEHRMLIWQTWKFGAEGLLYWGLNWWKTNIPNHANGCGVQRIEEWPHVPWNAVTYVTYTGGLWIPGDGHLIYPGPCGRPMPSIRLELIREGLQDYEYLKILSDRIKSAKGMSRKLLAEAKALAAVRPCVTSSVTKYTDAPKVLLAERDRIGDMIEKLILLKKPPTSPRSATGRVDSCCSRPDLEDSRGRPRRR